MVGSGDTIPVENIFVSSSWDDTTHGKQQISLQHDQIPSSSSDFTTGAWRPANEDIRPWVKIDLTSDLIISGIATQGEISTCRWVTHFKVFYLNTGWPIMITALPERQTVEVC